MTNVRNRYVSHFFFAGADDVPYDIFGTLFRLNADEWKFEYRVRTCSGNDDPWNNSDKKSHWECLVSGDEDSAASKIKDVFRVIVKGSGLTADVVPVHSDEGSVILKALEDKPWAHIRLENIH